MPGAITIDHLRKLWPDGSVGLNDVSLSIPAGEIVAILGRSGAGKSTLLRCASRLIEPTAGRVRVGDVDVTAARGRALARARGRIGFVFQQFNLIRSYTVLRNVLTARIAHTSYARGLFGIFSDADRDLALKSLRDVGLGDKANALARDLSGGQQQRVAIARAFAQQPGAIFADEPTASLDPKLAEVVLGMLRDYGKSNGVPVLINVHAVEHARKFCDRVIGMRRGQLVHDGPSSALDEAALEVIYADAHQESGS